MALPMRILIGAMVAFIVLIVAVVTLVITLTTASSSIQRLAEDYSRAVVHVARLRTEHYVDVPRQQISLIQELLSKPGDRYTFPIEDPDPQWCAKYRRLAFAANFLSNFSTLVVALTFEDGGTTALIPTSKLPYARRWQHNCRTPYNAASRNGFLTFEFFNVDLENNTEVEIPNPDPLTFENATDSRTSGYFTLLPFVSNSKRGSWFSMVIYVLDPYSNTTDITDKVKVMLPTVGGIWNASGKFMGSVTTGLDPGQISSFLTSSLTLAGTAAFAIDSLGRLMGSTTGDRFFEFSQISTRTAPFGCIGEELSTKAVRAFYFMVCVKTVKNYPYAPLNAVAGDDAFLHTRTEQLKRVDVDGNTYFLLSAAVQSPYIGLGMNIIFSLPEEAVSGDIVTSRNIAIGSTCALVVVASALSFLIVFFFLRPLNKLAGQMHETARLRTQDLDPDQVNYSALSEVCALQKSYVNMNNAIHSFTRYVPKDVVTELMMSGQLCEIKMHSMLVTTLFTDIQGFTTICERVPVDALSDLVSGYFDVMSRIVMDLEGLIDKYIGDCIMAVWGAPFPVANQEVKATLCGLRLHRATLVKPLSTAFDSAGELLCVRVGINTGKVLAGNMGSMERMNYTVIGDSVNIAARLESINKQFGTRVLISETTALGLGTSIFVLRLIMSVIVIGRAHPIKIYDVVGLQTNISESDRETLKHNDEQGKANRNAADQGTDTATVSEVAVDPVSSRSEAYSTTKPLGPMRLGRKHDTYNLLSVAKDETDVTLLVSEGDSHFAAKCSEATRLLLAKEYAQCLTALSAIDAAFCNSFTGSNGGMPSTASEQPMALRRTVAQEKHLDVLRTIAEEGLRDPSTFKGYYEATEK